MTELQPYWQEAIRKITQNFPKLLTEGKNEYLLCEITLEEVEQVVLDIPKGKSPSPDDFTNNLFHSCCSIIKQDI